MPVPRGPTNRIACATRLSARHSGASRRRPPARPPGRTSGLASGGRSPDGPGGRWVPSRRRWCSARARVREGCSRAPPVDRPTPGPTTEGSSDQAVPRHPTSFAECCFLPDLTRFAIRRCAGPDPQHRLERRPPGAETSRGNSALLERIAVQGTASSPPSTAREGYPGSLRGESAAPISRANLGGHARTGRASG